MKKIISIFVLVLGFNFQAQGQTSARNENLTRGHHSFGVSSNTLAFTKTVYKYENSKVSGTNIDLDLDLGYFIIDKLKLGLFTKVTNQSVNKSDKNFFSIGPGLTYYFTGKSYLTPYLLSSGGYYKTKSYSYHESGYTLDFGVGALYMINKNIGFNAHLLYDYKKGTRKWDLLFGNDPNDPSFNHQKSFSQSNLSFRIGFSVFL